MFALGDVKGKFMGEKLSICWKLPFSSINSLLQLIFDLDRLEWVLVHPWVSSSKLTAKVLVNLVACVKVVRYELGHVYLYVRKSRGM